MVVRGDDDLVSTDEDSVHEVLEELVAGLRRIDGGLSESLVERADACLVLVQRRLHVLSLDRLVKFRLLCLQRVHGLSSARVKNALRDRLDEVGELGFHVRPSGFESLKDLISVPVGLLVVVGEVHRERGQQLGLSEEGLDDLHNAQLGRILADGLRRALLLALVQAVVIPVPSSTCPRRLPSVRRTRGSKLAQSASSRKHLRPGLRVQPWSLPHAAC